MIQIDLSFKCMCVQFVVHKILKQKKLCWTEYSNTQDIMTVISRFILHMICFFLSSLFFLIVLNNSKRTYDTYKFFHSFVIYKENMLKNVCYIQVTHVAVTHITFSDVCDNIKYLIKSSSSNFFKLLLYIIIPC